LVPVETISYQSAPVASQHSLAESPLRLTTLGTLDPRVSFKRNHKTGVLTCRESKYTDKQDRKAEHIAEGYEKRGVSEKEAERRAWATVNKDDGGGKKEGGSGRGQATGHPAPIKAAKRAGRPPLPDRPASRSASARKAAATRRRNAEHRAHG
jgi:plasmid stabilization system protein ParE